MSTTATQSMIQPYVFFGGRCEEAIEFYQQALGAQLQTMMRFGESPDPTPEGMLPAGFEEKIMHSALQIGQSIIMLSDGCEEGGTPAGFSLSITLPTEQEARKAFEALSAGGQVRMPMCQTFWSPCFGMVQDQFGIDWMVTIP